MKIKTLGMSFLKDIVARRQLSCDPANRRQYNFFGRTIELQEDPGGGVGGSLWECVCLLPLSVSVS